MSKDRTPLYNGLWYGMVAGPLGSLIVVFIVVVVPEEALIAPLWMVLGGGILFWFFVCFLVGVFNAPRSAKEIAPLAAEPSHVQRILLAAGWFCYRLVVGSLVGIIATVALSLAVFSSSFAAARLFLDLEKPRLDAPVEDALHSSIVAGFLCGFSGGVFGALLAGRRSPSHPSAVSSRAVRSNFVAFLMGVPFGASLGWLTPEETRFFVLFVGSVPIGVLAGILGGIWTDVRDRRT